MSHIRTRISAVLYDGGAMPATKAAQLADELIRELGLRRDTVGLIHRWVTEWETTND